MMRKKLEPIVKWAGGKERELTTSQLIPQLRGLLKPADEDLEILGNRNDDKFSQKVRNLKAHNTFERYEFAKYENGIVSITNKGMNYLQENMDKVNYLLIPVCSNCHRMIHCNRREPLQIDFLIRQIK